MKWRLLPLVSIVVAAGVAARPVKILRNSSALEFTYAWPSEAAAIPALNRLFRTEMANDYRRRLKLGREDQKLYRQQGRETISDFYNVSWTTAGETPRLLSLQRQLSEYTGGAHPNTSYSSLLWDRKLNRQVAMVSLMTKLDRFSAAMRTDYCRALDRERHKRRGEDWKMGLADFDDCPKFSDLAIAPLDKNRNGRFDRIDFVASPYTAGPYAEGEYEISLPVSPKLIAALKSEYRSSFEAQRQ